MFILDTLTVTMGGEEVEIDLGTSRATISIQEVIGDIKIEAHATKAKWFIKDGNIVDDSYIIEQDGYSSIKAQEGYIEFFSKAQSSCGHGISWQVNDNLQLYSKMYWEFSNPYKEANGSGGYLFAGKDKVSGIRNGSGDQGYADASFARLNIGRQWLCSI